MKFCVCIKQVADVQSTVQTGRMVLNAYDASAVEEALVINSESTDEIDLVLVGPASATETIRKALAMGAHNAFHLVFEESNQLDSFAVAGLLAGFLSGRSYDVILTGKQAQDSDAGLVGGMLAELLKLPYATNAVGMSAQAGGLHVKRQGDTGQEILILPIPCLVTCSNDMNNPRIPSLKGIMGAKRTTIATETGTLGNNGTLANNRTQVTRVFPPAAREPGIKLSGEPDELVAQLLTKLQTEAGVL